LARFTTTKSKIIIYQQPEMMKEEQTAPFNGENVTEFLESYEELTLTKIEDAFLAKLLEKSEEERKRTMDASLDRYRCGQIVNYVSSSVKPLLKNNECYKSESRTWVGIKKYLKGAYADSDSFETRESLKKWCRSERHSDVNVYTEIFALKNSKLERPPDEQTLVEWYSLGLGKERLELMMMRGATEDELPVDSTTGLPIKLVKTQEFAKKIFGKVTRQIDKLFKEDEQETSQSLVFVPDRSSETHKRVKFESSLFDPNSLAEQFQKLTLEIEALKRDRGSGSTAPGLKRFGSPAGDSSRRCVICDKTDCFPKARCPDYIFLKSNNHIGINAEGHATWPSGEKIPSNYGRGGILKLVKEKVSNDSILNARH
jgi:hypothetical protein